MILFYVLSFFKKGDTIQGGDIIQGRTLFKEIRYSLFLEYFRVWIKDSGDFSHHPKIMQFDFATHEIVIFVLPFTFAMFRFPHI